MPLAVEPRRLETRKEPRRVALVHDYLVQDGGSERVLLALHELYPRAPIFTLFHNPARTHIGFKHADIRPSHLNSLPFAKKKYQWYLPLMPDAVERFDLSNFDLGVSSSSTFAKGAIAAPEGLHICYCHTPTRFLWQERAGYVNELPQPRVVKRAIPPLLHFSGNGMRSRHADPTSCSPTAAHHNNASAATTNAMPRSSPRPVDIERIPLSTKPGTYWLTGGRLVAYKRFDLVVQAFAKLNVPLKIFGEGPERDKLRQDGRPKNRIPRPRHDETKLQLFRDAISFLHPQIEDFGITASRPWPPVARLSHLDKEAQRKRY
jgi:glycosyltransferase involved in cell wall biosynthesis